MNIEIEPPKTFWQMFVEIILDPFHLLQSTVEYFQAWLFTRRWWSLLIFLPALALLLTTLGLIGFGAWISDQKLLQRYSARSQAETTDSLAEDSAASDQLLKDESVSSYAELLLRRVLQLENSNTRATYLVAVQLAKNGRVGQSRQMMRSLAPKNGRGFAPAHAWLAADRLTRGGKSREEILELLHDLEVASSWGGTSPAMLSIFSDLLEREGKIGESIAVLTEAAKREPKLQVKLANLAYRHNRKQSLEQASTLAKAELQKKVDSKDVSAADYASLANLSLLEQKTDEAIDYASRGLAMESENPTLKRLLSEAFRLKYMLSIKSSTTGTEVNLGLLDAALKADPTNPTLSEEIAKLQFLGQQASPELESALQSQLANGQATAITHVLLANKKLVNNELAEAIPHLELALRLAPNSPIIKNNLALAIARSKPTELARANELIDQAVKLSPPNAELFDSQGEIRKLTGDFLGAITSYEAAIGLDINRLESRRQLAACYQLAGMADMAKAQLAEIGKLSEAAQASTKQE